jgi:cysteine synthase B
MPDHVSHQRKHIVRANSARQIYPPTQEGQDGAIRRVQTMVARDPDRYYHPNQYDNPDNWLAHFYSTGPEIWRQTGGRVTHFVTAMGTSGTFMGVGRYLKMRQPQVQLISVEPVDAGNVMEGVKHMETAIVPAIFDPALKDGEVRVSTAQARKMARRLLQAEGLFVGFSAGAAVHSALQVARQLQEGVVVAVLADGGARYASLW